MSNKNYEVSGQKVRATYPIIATSEQMEHSQRFDSIGEAASFANLKTEELREAIEKGWPVKVGNITWYFDEAL